MSSSTDSQGRRRVTIDTGGHGDAFIGALLTWLHTPRGGYGYTMPVNAKVVSIGRSKIRIEVMSRHGTRLARSVMPDNLRWRVP